MSGIYIHIPFCKQACTYCNFHFSTSTKYKKPIVDAICMEIELRHTYLDTKEPLTSIYFGGGTPSLLEIDEFDQIMDKLSQYFLISENMEVTLEANPDDLTKESVTQWRNTLVNRLSIGIQSFKTDDLKYMNRAHNARESINCISIVQAAGFYDLSVDLIYGIPHLSDDEWRGHIQTVLKMGIPHISAYALTVEEKTKLAHDIKKGIMEKPKEEAAAHHFEILVEMLTAHGYEHYEISNFCLPNRYAVHNTNYWRNKAYLGLGPSAHSFNGQNRAWNIANNARYLKAINEGVLPLTEEVLSTTDRYNEYIMTGLRTQWGIKRSTVAAYGTEILAHFDKEIQNKTLKDYIYFDRDNIILKTKGKLIADSIMSQLFFV